MSNTIKLRCHVCKTRFEAEILTEREQEEARRENRPTSSIRCPNPKCRSIDVRPE